MLSIKHYEPLWGTWYIESLIGQGAFGKVYKIKRQEFGNTYYSAVKIISVPQDASEIKRLETEGLDEQGIRKFFEASISDISNEITLMNHFIGHSHVVSFGDYMVRERPDEIGWDILIRMELLKSLSDHAKDTLMTQSETLKLGIHICRALEVCVKKDIIHRDIKPENIFISGYGDYKLGDFGIARQIEHTMSGLSKKGTYTSMAPEVFKGEPYGINVDIYSLGIVMYCMLNKNRAPFLPGYPQSILPSHQDAALQRRMNGEPLPPIPGISWEMNAVIQKACAYDREERFSSPSEMREALEALSEAERSASEMCQPEKGMDLNNQTTPLSQYDQPYEEKPSLSPVLSTASSQGQKENKTKRTLFISVLGITTALMVLIGVLAIFHNYSDAIFSKTVEGYGISINSQVDFVLSNQEEAQKALEDFKSYYVNLSETDKVISVTFEENIEIVGTKSQATTIKTSVEVVKALIDGKLQSCDYTILQEETLQTIAQKHQITIESILEANEHLTAESLLTVGAQIKLVLVQPYLNVIVTGIYEVTEDIDFISEKRSSPEFPLNTETVQQAGQKGSKDVTYTCVTKNGVLIEESILQETITKEPVNEIVTEGLQHPELYDIQYDAATKMVKGSIRGVENPEEYRVILFILTDQWYVKPDFNAITRRGLSELQNKQRFMLKAFSDDQYANDIQATQYAVVLVPSTYKGLEHQSDFDGAKNASVYIYIDIVGQLKK